jgi:hypothetical protein
MQSPNTFLHEALRIESAKIVMVRSALGGQVGDEVQSLLFVQKGKRSVDERYRTEERELEDTNQTLVLGLVFSSIENHAEELLERNRAAEFFAWIEREDQMTLSVRNARRRVIEGQRAVFTNPKNRLQSFSDEEETGQGKDRAVRRIRLLTSMSLIEVSTISFSVSTWVGAAFDRLILRQSRISAMVLLTLSPRDGTAVQSPILFSSSLRIDVTSGRWSRNTEE